MNALYSNCTNKYPVSKTLKFELKPIGKTLENIEKKGYIAEDEKRAEYYRIVKYVIDRYHKKYIEETLKNAHLEGLEEYMSLYNKANRSDQENKEFRRRQEVLRKQIANFLKAGVNGIELNDLFGKELIKTYLQRDLDLTDEENTAVESFKSFTTYFQGFRENRKNIYTDEEKSTGIAYRLINQNLPKFVDNINQFKRFCVYCDENTIATAEKNCKEFNFACCKFELKDYFDIDYFDFVLSQAGIDVYNRIVGELNKYINEHNQKLDKDQRNLKIGKLKVLYKQILSDKTDSSFAVKLYENDRMLISDILKVENEVEIPLKTVAYLLENIDTYDTSNIYIGEKNIKAVSQKVYAGYDYIGNNMSIKKNHYYSLNEIEVAMPKESKGKLYSWTKSQTELIDMCFYAKENLDRVCLAEYPVTRSLSKDKIAVSAIKQYLDSLMDVLRLVKMYIGYDGVKDEMFYGDLSSAYMSLDNVVSVYNMTRNYITKKPYSTERVKLNFSKGTFLDGWDLSKESTNLGTILLKEDNYYLAIIDKSNSGVFKDIDEAKDDDDVYKKMEYKQLSNVVAQLPRIAFSASGIKLLQPSDEILKIKNNESFKKGTNFNIDDCHKLIDYYKEFISLYPAWKNYGFEFSDTSTYEDISVFYKEITDQAYKLSFKNINVDTIDAFVDEGKLHLFQIYNKDFSACSKGIPNLHTLYWKAIFSPENLKDVVYKLNGGAEMFYRKTSIKSENRIIHTANQAIKNKNPNNPKKISKFKYDIIKDRRFTVDKFQLHVPITMNFKTSGKGNINEEVNKAIKYGDIPYVIGIDRGERHLFYVSVINPEGKIVEQFSLNEIASNGYIVNYHDLLDSREKERVAAKKDWESIEFIKNLKAGYMSQVIHVITNLMKKYNAIIVLEDLNAGFKRGRQKVEKQVYQNFEKALIEKLNYFVDKSEDDVSAESGLFNAYQLTNKFESFNKLGKQSGVLFYIPAWNTSKLDPTTGFVNLFYAKYESIAKSKDFWNKFKSIRFNGEYFEFEVDDYSKFTNKAIGSRKAWTICSYGERIRTFRNRNKNGNWDNETVEPTKMLIDLFEKYEIDYKDGDLVDLIVSKTEKDFFSELFYIFKLIVQMRNSITGSNVDYMISPVKNKDGKFYDSRKHVDGLPDNADANGAYNIARKGLWVVEQIKNTEDKKLGKPNLKIDNKTWLKYAQENC